MTDADLGIEAMKAMAETFDQYGAWLTWLIGGASTMPDY